MLNKHVCFSLWLSVSGWFTWLEISVSAWRPDTAAGHHDDPSHPASLLKVSDLRGISPPDSQLDADRRHHAAEYRRRDEWIDFGLFFKFLSLHKSFLEDYDKKYEFNYQNYVHKDLNIFVYFIREGAAWWTRKWNKDGNFQVRMQTGQRTMLPKMRKNIFVALAAGCSTSDH